MNYLIFKVFQVYGCMCSIFTVPTNISLIVFCHLTGNRTWFRAMVYHPEWVCWEAYDAFIIFFLLEYSRFAMLCQFLLYSKGNQLYIYVYPVFFQFPFHFNLHRALSPLCSTVVYLLFISYIVVCVCGNPSMIRVLLSGSVHSFNNSTYWSLCARLCAKRLIDRLSLNPCITFSLQRGEVA